MAVWTRIKMFFWIRKVKKKLPPEPIPWWMTNEQYKRWIKAWYSGYLELESDLFGPQMKFTGEKIEFRKLGALKELQEREEGHEDNQRD